MRCLICGSIHLSYSCIPNNGTGWNNNTGWKHTENLIKVRVQIIIQVGKVQIIEQKCRVFLCTESPVVADHIKNAYSPRSFAVMVPKC